MTSASRRGRGRPTVRRGGGERRPTTRDRGQGPGHGHRDRTGRRQQRHHLLAPPGQGVGHRDHDLARQLLARARPTVASTPSQGVATTTRSAPAAASLSAGWSGSWRSGHRSSSDFTVSVGPIRASASPPPRRYRSRRTARRPPDRPGRSLRRLRCSPCADLHACSGAAIGSDPAPSAGPTGRCYRDDPCRGVVAMAARTWTAPPAAGPATGRCRGLRSDGHHPRRDSGATGHGGPLGRPAVPHHRLLRLPGAVGRRRSDPSGLGGDRDPVADDRIGPARSPSWRRPMSR